MRDNRIKNQINFTRYPVNIDITHNAISVTLESPSKFQTISITSNRRPSESNGAIFPQQLTPQGLIERIDRPLQILFNRIVIMKSKMR
ncbi:hypothetical protein D3C84_1077270 [compost metagenome]